jgi:uncharacterized protein (DUF1697 family)
VEGPPQRVKLAPTRGRRATTTYIALLRAINVAGRANVAMADLRALVTGLGFTDVRSLLQTGNLVFRGDDAVPANLERQLESAAAKQLNLRTDFMVRTADEWAGVVAGNPFPDMVAHDPGHLVVMALKQAPDQQAVEALRAAIKGREAVHVEGPHAYVTYPTASAARA